MIKLRKILTKYITIPFFIFFILLWEFWVRMFHIPTYLFPAPTIVLLNVIDNIKLLSIDTLITFYEAVFGFLLGVLGGFLWSILFAQSKLFEKIFYPYIAALQTIPIIAIAPLLVIWCGNGYLGKIIMAAFICFFPVVVNTTLGFKLVDKNSLDLMYLYNANKREVFYRLKLPSAMPYFFSALKISAIFCVIGAIVAELAGAKAGIGFRIIISSYRLDTEMMFSALIFSGLLGILFSKIVSLIENKVFFWKKYSTN